MPEVDKIIDFEIPKLSPSIIMVTGVGGGGSNAVNHMFEMEIADVSFMVCNTDPQALRNSPVPVKVRLGQNGLGAGNNPEKGRQAALESLDEIVEIYKREGTKMVFITAGMGGGTGTGAAPVIAKAARELGILTVAIVTIPFKTEGPKRMKQAYQGIDELRECVDSLLLINNENIQEIFGKLTLTGGVPQGRRHFGHGGQGHRRSHHARKHRQRGLRRRADRDDQQRRRADGFGTRVGRGPGDGGGQHGARVAFAEP